MILLKGVLNIILSYLLGRYASRGAALAFRLVYILAVLIGPYLTVAAVWNLADIFNALMAIPNVIALIALSGVIRKETFRSNQKS